MDQKEHRSYKKFALRGMIVLAVIIALCILFSGTIRTLTTPKVRYAPVKMGKFESTTDLTGKVVFPETNEIALDIPEGLSLTVTRVAVSPGDKVKKGAKLMTTVVTDGEKTLATLQEEYNSAQEKLESWDRKNGSIRLSRGELQWKEAWENAREAEKKEREARLAVMAELDIGSGDTMPETLPEKAGKEAKAAWKTWETEKESLEKARSTLKSLDKFAISEETWSTLQQRDETEQKLKETESQIMQILLLQKQAETMTAPYAGYVVSLGAEKGGIITGDAPVITLTAEGKKPVIRTDISDIKQKVSKGTTITIPTDSWGRAETKVVDTGLSENGHPYADAEINDDVTWALGNVSKILDEEIKLKLTTKAQDNTCLVPSAAIRGSGNERYVYTGEQETSALAGSRITVQKVSVTVLAENAGTVSIAEDLVRSKVLYMEDRAITEGGAVMLYEE